MDVQPVRVTIAPAVRLGRPIFIGGGDATGHACRDSIADDRADSHCHACTVGLTIADCRGVGQR